MQSVLTFENVSFHYEKDAPLIQNLSFCIAAGEFVTLLGPSGCGKSTLLRLICQLEAPTEGNIQFHTSVGYMPQKDLLMPWRTIYDNAILPLQIQKKNVDHEKVMQWMTQFGLDSVATKFPYELSGGMRQRAAFLRTFLTESPLLAMDEPFSALDAITKDRMEDWLLLQCKAYEKTAVFVTHDLEEAWKLSDRIFVMTKNAPMEVLSITEAKNDPQMTQEVKRSIRDKLRISYEQMT